MTTPTAPQDGATSTDWLHFELVLGLGEHMLPVVHDSTAKPSAGSAIKEFGKIPSQYNAAGEAHGLKGWQSRAIAPAELQYWSADRRYSVCVRCQAVRAIDCDITDVALAERVAAFIAAFVTLSKRTRANSPKFLHAFLLPGAFKKRRLRVGEGQFIELLADGQQFVAAGRHPSGARYEWQGGLPCVFPELTAEQFEALWCALAAEFGISPPVAERTATPADVNPETLASITDEQLTDLREALAHPALLQAAGDEQQCIKVGYALLSLGDVGQVLWLNFCRHAADHSATPDSNWPFTWWAAHTAQKPRSDFRHIYKLAAQLGWANPHAGARLAKAADFPQVDQTSEVQSGEVPPAHHLCTDQANANRIRAAFGKRIISVAGGFYGWTGTHWARDEGEAHRCAMKLSSIVEQEAKAARAKYDALAREHVQVLKDAVEKPRKRPLASSDAGKALIAADSAADALEAWSRACEMEPTQTKALKLLRKSLTIEASKLDSDIYALNCLSGTIDLRTGKLKAHDPKDYITRCAPVKFNATAEAPRFEQFLTEIMGDDAPRAAFLRRWFGYCATGDVREQKFVVHIGPGGNGKGTLLKIVAELLGEYASTAAPGLLAGSGGSERHPTEIASLMGRRMITAHESDEGAVLREGFIKQATDDDMLTGRWMRGDFFAFQPTHKIQLLTNHKPTIRGADFGIWRRVLLINYPISFGSAEDVAEKRASRLRDTALTDTLRTEREGVFAWIIRGAAEWHQDGLIPPDSVLAAGRAYQSEQDRARQFVDECCIVDKEAWSPFSGMFGGLYPAYTCWCRSSGYQALGKGRFIQELERVVPYFRKETQKRTENGTRKQVHGACGLRVNPDDDGGGETVSTAASNACRDLIGNITE